MTFIVRLSSSEVTMYSKSQRLEHQSVSLIERGFSIVSFIASVHYLRFYCIGQGLEKVVCAHSS